MAFSGGFRRGLHAVGTEKPETIFQRLDLLLVLAIMIARNREDLLGELGIRTEKLVAPKRMRIGFDRPSVSLPEMV